MSYHNSSPSTHLGTTLLLLCFTLTAAPRAFAHGDQIEVGGGARGPITLNATQRQAIGLKTAPVDNRTIDTYLQLNGEVRVPPDREANVSTRISGQAKTLYVGLGAVVRAGQPLAKIESRLSGNPPPSVVLTAPISGTIDARAATPGQTVEPDSVLFHISDRRRMLVIAKVYEEDLGKVQVGQDARVHVLSYPQQVFAGKITLIDPNLDAVSRTVSVWIELDNAKDLLKPNMFARANVITSHNSDALAVPNNAILEANGEQFVFVAEGERFNRIEVSTGARDDQFTEITDGLTPGDEVVTQGNSEIYTQWLTGGVMKDED